MTDDAARIQAALAAFVARDAAKLDEVLSRDPGVVNLRIGDNTMLELATQPPTGGVPADVVEVLIRRGAELDRALNLAACFNLAPLVAQLLEGGADPSARADADITPLESAAMHGSVEAADILVEHGVHRDTLWLSAASGQLDRVQTWVDASGNLLRPSGSYRPNFADVGRPSGEPHSDEPEEILGEALVFAAANGREPVVSYLLSVGVNIDARPYRNTTGLHLAIQFRKVSMVRFLLANGAVTDVEDDQYRSNALGWATACNNGERASKEILDILARGAAP